MKYLTLKVRDIVMRQQQTTYKDVAAILLNSMSFQRSHEKSEVELVIIKVMTFLTFSLEKRNE